jgi:hypothetical protein
MNKLIDVMCPACGVGHVDVWVPRNGQMPVCQCQPDGSVTERWWRSGPGITPQGTRPERNTARPRLNRVDTKAIAAETMAEIDQKMLRYSDPVVAEENISREVNAHIYKPVPTPAPIMFERPRA